MSDTAAVGGVLIAEGIDHLRTLAKIEVERLKGQEKAARKAQAQKRAPRRR